MFRYEGDAATEERGSKNLRAMVLRCHIEDEAWHACAREPGDWAIVLQKNSSSKLNFRERWRVQRVQPSCFSDHDEHTRQDFLGRG